MEEKIVQEFHDAYIKADEQCLEDLWKNKSPKSLVHFYSGKYESKGDNYLLKSISNNTLWLSSPQFFNDPFDCVINTNFHGEAKKFSEQILNKYFDKDIVKSLLYSSNGQATVEKIAEYLKGENEGKHLHLEKSIYVSCFSEKDNLHSLRMWAHYANNHSGVCVEYDFNVVNNVSPFGCIPIKYTDDYKYLLYTSNISEDVTNYMKFFTKAKEWSYEKEWRVAQNNENPNTKGYSIPIALPLAVYIGCKTSERLKEDVIRICKSKNIPAYQMKLKPGSFQLYYELIDEQKTLR